MSLRIVAWWGTALLLCIAFLVFRVVIPGLINSHNDGAIILAIVLFLLVPTVGYVYWVKFLDPYLEGKFS